jgi:hypothetical protein
MFLYGGHYVLFLLFFYLFVLLLAFVEYVAFIFSGVVSALVFGHVYLGDLMRTCCYLVFVSCSTLSIGLCVSRFVSFICRLFLLVLYMWYFSSVVKCFSFVCVLIMSIVSVMVPYLCPVFSMWFEYLGLLLLFLIAPAYELAKHLPKILHNSQHLPYAYNIHNSTQLITDLKTI